MLLVFLNSFLSVPCFSASSVEDTHKEARERKEERGKAKLRHKFTKRDLEILDRSFELNPYPDFTIKEELANQIHCQISVIHVSPKSKH